MSIEGLVVTEAMRHIEDFGCVKNMESFALHILKTSENPSVIAMRRWMRRTAYQQAKEAEREQKVMNDQFAQEPYNKRVELRRRAVVHPYFATKAVQQGHSWGDKDFLGYIQKENPKVFPKREAR